MLHSSAITFTSSMEIKKNTSLKPYNTFGIDVKSSQFVEVDNIQQLEEVLNTTSQLILVLGGGSNLLFTKDVSGLVIKNNIKGIDIIKESDDDVILKVGSGEVWHHFVLYCIEKGYAGVENMSLIPGSVGASPMQNIGAYGAEVKDVITQVEAYHFKTKKVEIFTNEQCEFGYRTSIFKTSQKENYFITSVTYKLSKKPVINTSYGAIEDELKKMGIANPSIKDISNAVIHIRNSKLPDPEQVGNAGSFFKNPIISKKEKDLLLTKYPELPCYVAGEDTFKIAAGWLIEKCGWKGKKINNYGVHDKQALVLVNYGGAEGAEIHHLSQQIITSVKQNFGITLEREVNIM